MEMEMKMKNEKKEWGAKRDKKKKGCWVKIKMKRKMKNVNKRWEIEKRWKKNRWGM